jgi:hypothetical protein
VSAAETLGRVVGKLGAVRFNFATEDELQRGIGEALDGEPVEREARLDSASRIDFLIEGVGIEAKIGGGSSALTRQLMRYAKSDRIEALIVVTSKEQHRLQIPSTMNGKPVRVLSLRGAFA